VAVNGVAIGAKPVQVTPGPVNAAKSTVTVSSSVLNSGSTDAVTIAVKDAAGNPIAGLASSSFAFNFAGGTSTGTFGTVSATSTPGTYQVFLTGVLAGSASNVIVNVGGVLIAMDPSVTVIAGAVSAANSTVSFATSSVAVGGTDVVTISVNDAAGNTISRLKNSDFALSLSGGTSKGTFGPVKLSSVPGVYTAIFSGGTVGTASDLIVQVDGLSLSTQPSIQVT
jgi:hypothetical protein